jgi:hypothetical protein
VTRRARICKANPQSSEPAIYHNYIFFAALPEQINLILHFPQDFLRRDKFTIFKTRKAINKIRTVVENFRINEIAIANRGTIIVDGQKIPAIFPPNSRFPEFFLNKQLASFPQPTVHRLS